MMSQQIRVVIADDHPIVRAGLDATIQTDAYVTVVRLAKNFEELLQHLEQIQIDIVILDLIGMGTVPLSMLERMQRDYPKVGVVIFSSSVDMAPELLRAGALGYVAKDEDSDLLLSAIRAAASGQQYVSPFVQDYLDRVMSARQRQRFAPQEFNVLKLLANGLSTIKIAEELRIDPRTVQNYITSLRSKTGSVQRTQLAEFYRRYLNDNTE